MIGIGQRRRRRRCRGNKNLMYSPSHYTGTDILFIGAIIVVKTIVSLSHIHTHKKNQWCNNRLKKNLINIDK